MDVESQRHVEGHLPIIRTPPRIYGLLRAYFSKVTDLSVVSPEKLYRVAEEVNDQPRKTLDGPGPSTCSPASAPLPA